jgi:hypothetical protein
VVLTFGGRHLYATDYRIQVWDGVWTDIAVVTGNMEEINKHLFTPVDASKVRIYITAATDPGVYIKEFEIFEVQLASNQQALNAISLAQQLMADATGLGADTRLAQSLLQQAQQSLYSGDFSDAFNSAQKAQQAAVRAENCTLEAIKQRNSMITVTILVIAAFIFVYCKRKGTLHKRALGGSSVR